MLICPRKFSSLSHRGIFAKQKWRMWKADIFLRILYNFGCYSYPAEKSYTLSTKEIYKRKILHSHFQHFNVQGFSFVNLQKKNSPLTFSAFCCTRIFLCKFTKEKFSTHIFGILLSRIFLCKFTKEKFSTHILAFCYTRIFLCKFTKENLSTHIFGILLYKDFPL